MPASSVRSARHRVPLSLFVVAFVVSVMAASPAAGAGPSVLKQPAPSPTRGSEAKGGGSPRHSMPTGRLIVRYRKGVTQAQRPHVRVTAGAAFVSSVALPDTELVRPLGDIGATISSLRGRPEVLSVEREYRRTLFAGPVTEPRIGEQWSLNNTGQVVNGYAGAPDVDMNVVEAWQVTTGSPTVVVAVIDDGVDFSHPDLSGSAWVNPGEIPANGIDDDADGLVDDVNGWDFCNNDNTLHDAEDFHGTHVAGTIAASGNGIGVAGVAPNVKIMALKFINPDDPNCGTDTQAIAAINYAAAHGAQIINASWGGPDDSVALALAIDSAVDTLFVAAAGNDGSDNREFPVYPASYGLGTILSVASVHNEGFLSEFSNYGRYSVDIAAPGEDVLSTLPGATYGYLSGTSMAAANVSGAAALAVSAHGAFSFPGGGAGYALRRHLLRTAKALPSVLGVIERPRLIDARAAVVSRPDIKRLSGADRYATSAAISGATYVPHVPYLFIATGESFPDALAGGALAAQVGSPLLLVKHDAIPSVVLNEIKRLKPYHIFVLGGTGVLTAPVASQLAAYDDPASGGPYRLAGSDRYATAVAISQAGFDSAVTVFIANGMNFPDALAAGPAAAVNSGGPLLLVTQNSIPTVTRNELARLHPQTIVVVGGTGAISATVANQLTAYAGAVERWAGADRYATAAAIASNTGAFTATAFVASGLSFADALSGGAPAGANWAPLLLTASGSAPFWTTSTLQGMDPVRIFVLGGTGVVSDGVIAQIRALFP